MKIKCFNVEKIEYKDKDGNIRILYKVWFNLSTGLAWLLTDKPIEVGQDCQIDLAPMNTQDVKTNMRLTVRLV